MTITAEKYIIRRATDRGAAPATHAHTRLLGEWPLLNTNSEDLENEDLTFSTIEGLVEITESIHVRCLGRNTFMNEPCLPSFTSCAPTPWWIHSPTPTSHPRQKLKFMYLQEHFIVEAPLEL